MGSINISLDGGRAIEGELNRIIQRLPDALTTLLDDIGSDVEALMKDEAPVRLGDLQNSVTTDSVSMTERIVWPTMEYAPFVILGTRPHEINSSIMIEGNWFYIGMHPGTSPNPFTDRAADRADPFIETRMNEFYTNLLE